MTRNRDTLGGVPCPQYSTVLADICQRCNRPNVSINDIAIGGGCQCLTPVLKRTLAVKVETARVVDALGVQFDDKPETEAVSNG